MSNSAASYHGQSLDWQDGQTETDLSGGRQHSSLPGPVERLPALHAPVWNEDSLPRNKESTGIQSYKQNNYINTRAQNANLLTGSRLQSSVLEILTNVLA